ncbi:MAG: heavy-metal-associated domain-containing protein [Prosthecobacter sp.]|uniref:heavy-metal-associated domain-containing protein n=1 Tax=Prosthecobacter sp. TaxID=1965333 RepID=UPI0038FFF5C1
MRLYTAILCLALTSLHAEEMTVRILGFSHEERIADFHKMIATLPELKLVTLDADKASATLSYDPLVLLGKPKPKPEELAPEKILERIDNLIGKASVRTFTATKATGIADGKLTQVQVKVGVLDCKGCRYGAYIAIAKIEGVERASVNSDSRTLTAWIDATKTNKEAIEAALKKARVELH